MKRILIPLAILSFIPAAMGQVLLFSDDLDDSNGSNRWSAPIYAEENPALGADGTVDFAFDYSTIGAPSAPNSSGGSTIGIAINANITDHEGDEGESVGIVPISGGDMPAGDWRLSADVYMYVDGNSGSTEYAGMSVFSAGNAVPLRFSLDPGDGLSWQTSGEGGSTSDLFRFENPGAGETSLGQFEDTGIALLQNRWSALEIASMGGMVSFYIDGNLIDTFDNTGNAFSGGTFGIHYSDPFNSSNSGQVGVFDNIRLTANVIPEPGTLALFGFGAFALLVRRRAKS